MTTRSERKLGWTLHGHRRLRIGIIQLTSAVIGISPGVVLFRIRQCPERLLRDLLAPAPEGRREPLRLCLEGLESDG